MRGAEEPINVRVERTDPSLVAGRFRKDIVEALPVFKQRNEIPKSMEIGLMLRRKSNEVASAPDEIAHLMK